MKVIIVGASGTIGHAVADALVDSHDVISASRSSDPAVDLSDPLSIKAMYHKIPDADAVICTTGTAAFGPLDQLTDDDFAFGLGNKLMGQIHLVRYGRTYLKKSASFVLTSGLLAHQPGPGTVMLSMINAGVEAFAKAAALDMPNGPRVNVVCPPLVKETAEKMGWGPGGMPATEVAAFYVQALKGTMNGESIGPTH